MSRRYYHPQRDWFVKRNLDPPTSVTHGTEDDIQKQLKQLKPHSWRLEGNKLIAKTDMGELVNFIPTNYILTGEDDKGLPIFKEI